MTDERKTQVAVAVAIARSTLNHTSATPAELLTATDLDMSLEDVMTIVNKYLDNCDDVLRYQMEERRG